jgi:HD-GYP domain-containing protein (c-di-GMP phosphodiesterase class II)
VAHADEWFDGRGAPDGLAGEAIPFASRILSVVIAYVAMTTPGMRVRRQVLSRDRALAILKRQAGKTYDPRLVDALNDFVK